MEIKDIAIDEMNFLMSRCDCAACAASDIPHYDQYDFETLDEYHEYLISEPSCFNCKDTGVTIKNIGVDDYEYEKCMCRVRL